MNLVHLTGQLVALCGGAVACYAALFLYENEERRVQNVLENWWIKVHDLEIVAIGRHLAILRTAANLAQSWLDSLFGPRLISLNGVGVSACLSLISLIGILGAMGAAGIEIITINEFARFLVPVEMWQILLVLAVLSASIAVSVARPRFGWLAGVCALAYVSGASFLAPGGTRSWGAALSPPLW